MVTVIIVVVALWLLKKLVVTPLKGIFTAKPVKIDETPILIKEIKSIGQLITYSSLDEVVVDSTIVTKGSAFVNSFNRLSPFPALPTADKELVLIARGKVLAGVNLALLADNSVSVNNDTVRVSLPKAQILDAIVNPSNFETFVEKGNWTETEVILVKAKARRKIIEHALHQNILSKAETQAKKIMETFLQNMGYKNTVVY